MPTKAIIFDLDNTIYSVHSIADELFRSLFQLLDESGEAPDYLKAIKEDIKRKPFQWVAEKYGLSKELTRKSIDLLKHLTINGNIERFADFDETRKLSQEKFLVTTGFTSLQQSKIRKMGIESDFREIYIIDPEISTKTKRDIFEEILKKFNLLPSEVLVVGDDLESEIKAAQDLGIRAVLYRKEAPQENSSGIVIISDFGELPAILNSSLTARG